MLLPTIDYYYNTKKYSVFCITRGIPPYCKIGFLLNTNLFIITYIWNKYKFFSFLMPSSVFLYPGLIRLIRHTNLFHKNQSRF